MSRTGNTVQKHEGVELRPPELPRSAGRPVVRRRTEACVQRFFSWGELVMPLRIPGRKREGRVSFCRARLQGRSCGRDAENLRVHAFPLQQPELFLESSGIAGETAFCTRDATSARQPLRYSQEVEKKPGQNDPERDRYGPRACESGSHNRFSVVW